MTTSNKLLLGIFLLLLFFGYWILMRPSQIKQECYQKATGPWYSFSLKKEVADFRLSAYEECLKAKGL